MESLKRALLMPFYLMGAGGGALTIAILLAIRYYLASLVWGKCIWTVFTSGLTSSFPAKPGETLPYETAAMLIGLALGVIGWAIGFREIRRFVSIQEGLPAGAATLKITVALLMRTVPHVVFFSLVAVFWLPKVGAFNMALWLFLVSAFLTSLFPPKPPLIGTAEYIAEQDALRYEERRAVGLFNRTYPQTSRGIGVRSNSRQPDVENNDIEIR